MKHCANHPERPVFSKGLCNPCWKRVYGKPIVKKQVNIKPYSNKRQKDVSKYNRQVSAWKQENTECMAKLKGCTGLATECHHMEGRIGALLLDQSKWLPVCHNCHAWITENSNQAIELGLSFKRNTAA